MKKNKFIVSRRSAIATGLSAFGAAWFASCNKPFVPPTYGNILRMGDALTYTAHRTLFSGRALAKEYNYSEITSFPATGTVDPSKLDIKDLSDSFLQLKANNFSDYKLSVEGKVARPGLYSITDIMRMPSRKQITKHVCEEGWTAIGEWQGVPLKNLLEHAGILPTARFVNFHSFDAWEDSIDMIDAMHPQTILAYGMNGKHLPLQHGAPLRLRVETQIGYKSMKYLKKIVVTDQYIDTGDIGWAWYVGI